MGRQRAGTLGLSQWLRPYCVLIAIIATDRNNPSAAAQSTVVTGDHEHFSLRLAGCCAQLHQGHTLPRPCAPTQFLQSMQSTVKLQCYSDFFPTSNVYFSRILKFHHELERSLQIFKEVTFL